jgi:hypothetical protein
MVFHVQLAAVHTWLVYQLDVAETERLDPPEFYQGLHMLEVHNNLIWLPTHCDQRACLVGPLPVEPEQTVVHLDQAVVRPESVDQRPPP